MTEEEKRKRDEEEWKKKEEERRKEEEERDKDKKRAQTLRARLEIVVKTKDEGKEQALWGAYIRDEAGNYVFRVKYQEILLLDMKKVKDKIEISLPRKKEYYKGTVKEALANDEASDIHTILQDYIESTIFDVGDNYEVTLNMEEGFFEQPIGDTVENFDVIPDSINENEIKGLNQLSGLLQ